jgi:hypothetical protein
MRPFRGPRAIALIAATTLAAGLAGAALGHSATKTSVRVADVPAPRADRLMPRAGWPLAHDDRWKWSLALDGADTIQVRSRTCPKHHPHKVGSSSSSTTRIVDGKVEHRSTDGSVCAK